MYPCKLIKFSDIDVGGSVVGPSRLRKWVVKEFTFNICYHFPVKIHSPQACVTWGKKWESLLSPVLQSRSQNFMPREEEEGLFKAMFKAQEHAPLELHYFLVTCVM